VIVEETRSMSLFAVDGKTTLWSVKAEVFEEALKECPAARYAMSKDLKINKKVLPPLPNLSLICCFVC
jgi:CRP-like cAMP-binding protein